MRLSVALALLLALVLAFNLSTARADYAEREDVQAYIGELVAEHGFAKDTLQRLFNQAEKKQSILDAIARPAERTLKWHEYRKIFIKSSQFEPGLKFWRDNAKALARAETEYGVPARYIVAIIGVETRWGRVTGSYRVLDALATLGFDYPPRSEFFRKELTEFLLLAREEQSDPLELKGSYAGAMGFGQFIPSSFRAYAVDFDGDGKKDIWNNATDAIGSVANYFKRHGWEGQGPVAAMVSMPVDAQAFASLDALANETLERTHTVGKLRDMGLFVADLADAEQVALFRMEQPGYAEYWLGLNDFYAITRYNHSRLYAMAVYQLGQVLQTAHDDG
ncbi:MAG: lytic murein transglycosylase B [Pseudomonadales bacterium]